MKNNVVFQTLHPSSPYSQASKSFTYGVCISLPLLILYYEGSAYFHTWAEAIIGSNSTEWFMIQFLKAYNVFSSGTALLLLFGIIAGFAFLEQYQQGVPRIKLAFFPITIGESFFFALITITTAYWLINPSLYFPQLPFFSGSYYVAKDMFPSLVVSAGAGFFEELLWRAGLISLLLLAAKKLEIKDLPASAAAVALSALLFAFWHFAPIGPINEDPLTYPLFFFRFYAGIFFGIIYIKRGFGSSVWTHFLVNALAIFGAFSPPIS